MTLRRRRCRDARPAPAPGTGVRRAPHHRGRAATRCAAFGLAPEVLPSGTGVFCDVGTGEGPVIALRADIDALPIADEKDVAVPLDGRGRVPRLRARRAHRDPARRRRRRWPRPPPAGRVRLVFQPAEETVPGGAPDGDGRRHPRRRRADLRPALRSAHRDRPGRPARRADHRGLRPHRGPAVRLAAGTPPARTSPRTSCSRSGELITDLPGAAVAPRRPAGRAVAGLGCGRGRPRGQRHPAWPAGCAARCACSTATPGTTRRAARRAARRTRSWPPTGVQRRRRLHPRRAAGRQRRRRGGRAAGGGASPRSARTR